ncbi:MAG TPA: ROK family protein, partial [Thermoanaerobaculales bacterium]|nr:ROK family protein [Thermoanaerobaculales bacterium]
PEAPVGQIAAAIAELAAVAEELEPADSGHPVAAAGIVIPGVVFHGTGEVWAPNIAGWDHFPLAARLGERTSLPLVLDSDRAAYVLGEQWCGVAKGLRDVAFVAFGTGIGAGILVDGRLVRGSGDVAGAVGWFAIDPRFRPEYGERGCFECEASGTAVGLLARRALEQGRQSAIAASSGGEVTAEAVFRAADSGDALALEVLDHAVEAMAMGIANIVSILNPEIVVLGGGLFQSDLRLLGPVRSRVARWAQPLAAAAVRIEPSGLGEDAGLYGAAKLAWDSVRVWP